jgi:ribonuclease-3
MKQLDELCKRINYTFSDQKLVAIALTHRSATGKNNERMEFLGDSILGYVISNELYQRFPNAQEGQLSRLRASLVKGETLAELARSINLGDYLQMGSGELKSGGFRRSSILADAFEAIIGAIYLDSDIQQAEKFIIEFYNDKLESCDPEKAEKDPKTRLQEFLQAESSSLPVYTVLNIEGEAHNQKFEVECFLEERNIKQVAEGSSRRKAEQAAAQKLLDRLANE